MRLPRRFTGFWTTLASPASSDPLAVLALDSLHGGVSRSGGEPCFADEGLNGLVEGSVGGAQWWRCIGDDPKVERLESGS